MRNLLRLPHRQHKLLTKIEKNKALLIDDFGLQELTQECRLALLTLLQEMHEKGSLIIISQLPVDRWYDYLAEPTLADAIMDRLVGSSHHVNLTGPSMRKRKIKL